eukprot:CAMPEP_0181268694 /NCGR_PEP_ID=MMETSP1097-20121128/5692_1 /TAXON_ID=35684 /ORGANISM="Pseudopedinella elastica, Strain CCMP716" /LENGTH=54 /DNA_ID=CAMNT_0023368449 /DNA_START=335 /DNA_END=495 /DNA_ORIENTATION=-
MESAVVLEEGLLEALSTTGSDWTIPAMDRSTFWSGPKAPDSTASRYPTMVSARS